MTAGELSKIITWEVIRLHRVPSVIISDRGSLFTSWLWINLMYSFRIERWLSTAFHPKPDRQTEKQNSVLEQYLCSYFNYQHDDWVSLLASAEFAYNAAVHFLTGRPPFVIVYGEVLRSDMLTLDEVQNSATRGSSAEGESSIERIRVTREEVTNSLTRTQAYQARNTTNLIAMWSTRSARKFDSGLRKSQSSDRYKSCIGKDTAPIASLKE